MKLNLNLNVKIIAPVTLGVILLFVPASLGESGKPAPNVCEEEIVLLNNLQGVKTPRTLRKKILEAQKLLTDEAERLELSRIARAAKNASPAQIPTLKKRVAALLERKCVDVD
jgi:hypothetical protein